VTDREKFIALTGNDRLSKADVIVLLEGDGQARISHAVELFRTGYAGLILFSGGIDKPEYGSYPLNSLLPEILSLGVPENCIVREVQSLNTREQAENVSRLAVKNGWSRLILVASHYHQYRAFLTFLKVMEEMHLDRKLLLFNSPARPDWFEETQYGQRFQLLEMEFRKIEEYFSSGHIATYKSAIDFLKWASLQKNMQAPYSERIS